MPSLTEHTVSAVCMLLCLRGWGLGWPVPDVPASMPTDAMRQFMGQNARQVASFINACAMRASEQPPDDVLFGDALDVVDEDEAPEGSSADDYFECEQMWEVFDFALDSLLEVDGFFPGPP